MKINWIYLDVNEKETNESKIDLLITLKPSASNVFEVLYKPFTM